MRIGDFIEVDIQELAIILFFMFAIIFCVQYEKRRH